MQSRRTRGVLKIERYEQRLTHRACMREASSNSCAPAAGQFKTQSYPAKLAVIWTHDRDLRGMGVFSILKTKSSATFREGRSYKIIPILGFECYLHIFFGLLWTSRSTKVKKKTCFCASGLQL